MPPPPPFHRLDDYMENWIHAKEGVVYTPNQHLALFTEAVQGRAPPTSLQHTSNSAMLALIYAQYQDPHADNTLMYRCWARGQIAHILGDNGMGYVVGFGREWPKRPYHKAASCPDLSTGGARCSYETGNQNPAANYHVLLGAVVNGPTTAGVYKDDRDPLNWGNRVSLLNNAGFIGAVAGLAAGHISEAKCYQGYGIIQETRNRKRGSKY